MGERSTFPKINNLTKSMPIDDGESPLISEKFALEFGKLSSKSLINIPYPSKVAMGITSKCLQKLGSDKSWGSVLEIVMNNPALQCLDVKDIYHHADHEAPAKRWFQSDGYLNKSGVRKLQGWMKEFVPSQGLFDNEEVSEEFCLKVVQRTLAELKKWSDENPRSSMLGTFKRMWDKRPSNLRSWFGADTAHQEEDEEDTSEISGAVNAIQNVAGKKPKKTYKESPLIDIVVFRFPDFDQQFHFVAYHLKLCSWTSVTPNHDPKEGQIVKVGTRGEYHMRRFDVRREFIEEIGEQTKEKALQEVTDLLRKYDDA